MELLFYVSGGFAFISFCFYLYKFCLRRDYGFVGMMISRLLIVILWIIHLVEETHINHEDFLFVLSFMLIAETVNSGIYVFSRKYINQIQKNKAINESKKEIQEILDQDVGFLIITENATIKYCNSVLTEIFECQKEEILENSLFDFVHTEDLQKVKKEIQDKLDGLKKVSNYEFEIVTKKGNIKKVHAITSIITNGHKSITGSIVVKEE